MQQASFKPAGAILDGLCVVTGVRKFSLDPKPSVTAVDGQTPAAGHASKELSGKARSSPQCSCEVHDSMVRVLTLAGEHLDTFSATAFSCVGELVVHIASRTKLQGIYTL